MNINNANKTKQQTTIGCRTPFTVDDNVEHVSEDAMAELLGKSGGSFVSIGGWNTLTEYL